MDKVIENILLISIVVVSVVIIFISATIIFETLHQVLFTFY